MSEVSPFFRRPRRKFKMHLVFIATLPCIFPRCIVRTNTEAAHIRASALHLGKRPTGMAEKPDDCWTLPLCAAHHRNGKDAQHAGNELEFWANLKIDPFAIALALFAHSGETEVCSEIIRRAAW